VAERVARAAPLLPHVMPDTREEALTGLIDDADAGVAVLAGFYALEVGGEPLRNAVAEVRRLRPEVNLSADDLRDESAHA
jgi:hypothetical protein